PARNAKKPQTTEIYRTLNIKAADLREIVAQLDTIEVVKSAVRKAPGAPGFTAGGLFRSYVSLVREIADDRKDDQGPHTPGGKNLGIYTPAEGEPAHISAGAVFRSAPR
ncbi:hypothetical protein, partial [Nonomuraea sp. MG754425]|uniref:hypothetical protein n=1 Tax=Nonomuraea sp. MG754425 TaxID=2570319 RepID=UPI001F3BE2FD